MVRKQDDAYRGFWTFENARKNTNWFNDAFLHYAINTTYTIEVTGVQEKCTVHGEAENAASLQIEFRAESGMKPPSS